MNDKEAVTITGIYAAVVILMAVMMLFKGTCMQPLPEGVSRAVFPLTSINAAEPVPARIAL